MKTQNKNEKAKGINVADYQVLANLPKPAIKTLKNWFDNDPDFNILKDYLDLLPKLICDLILAAELNSEDFPDIEKQTRFLANLHYDLQTFSVDKTT